MNRLSGLPAGITGSRPFSNRLRLLARDLAASALDLVFPPRCIRCKRAGSLLCNACQSAIVVPPPVIERSSPLSERRATAQFEGAIQEAIHALKYNGQWRFADPLSQRLINTLSQSGWKPTLITAAPLHETRFRERGYNQSALLAEPVARAFTLPFRPDAIRRVRDTPAQVGLNAKERQRNVAGAFRAESGLVVNQQIVIVDDVYTTGATLRECASALLEAGASKVWALTVASARQRDSMI